MPAARINDRLVNIPSPVTGRQIRAAGNISPGRPIISRKREGNYAVKDDESVNVEEGDVFIDAPPRTKGN